MEKTLTQKKTNATYAICVTALFMALNILMSSFGVPVPGGRCYLNDVIICTAAILLDDPKAAFLLKEEMKQLCEAGGAIFFSTHVLEVAEKICNKIAIIKGGKLIVSGDMEEVKGDESLESVFLELEG